MKIKNATLKELNINWYMARKPYQHHSDYDLFYLNICREVFELLARIAAKGISLTSGPDRAELAELAYVATAYFEDKATGIGFWNACSALFRERIGKAAPFYPEESYEEAAAEGDINPFDLQYLFFLTRVNYFNASVEDATVLPFYDPFIVEAAAIVFDHLDAIEEITETDFYNTWRDVRADDYIALKAKIVWFAQRGYVFTSYLSGKLRADIEQLEDVAYMRNRDKEQVYGMIYQQTDVYSFQTPSSLMALCAVDILARMFTATDHQREQLLRMKNRPTGNFQVEERGDGNYLFTHTITDDRFIVSAGGMNGRLPVEVATLYQVTLAEWGDGWHVSGMCIPVTKEHVKKADVARRPVFCAYNAAHRAKVEELANEQSRAKLEYFGGPLTNFPDVAALEESLNGFYAFYTEKMWQQKHEPGEQAPTPIRMDFGGSLPRNLPAALFLPPGDGEEIMCVHERLSRILQTEDVASPKPDDILFAGECFTDDGLSVPYWHYLRQEYGSHTLSAVLMAPCADDRDFEALLRIYRPYEYAANKLPRLTIVNS